jgi:hypothetical protein
MDIEASPTYQELPEHAKPAWLKAVRAFRPAWLLPPTTGELFEGRDRCLKRLNGYGLYEGFVVVSGRVWKETTPRWQFLCKMHSRATANKRGLEARKYRIGNLSYSESQALLEQEHQGLILNQKTYYNLLRKKPGDANNPGTITALLKELHEAGFVYRTRTKDEVDANGRVIKRKLIQIIFFHREVILRPAFHRWEAARCRWYLQHE